MLEERRNAVSEAVARRSKGKKLFIEEVEAVSAMWEVLMEDETVEKIKEDVWQADLKIDVVKEDMKKLSIKEKIANFVELQQLQ